MKKIFQLLLTISFLISTQAFALDEATVKETLDSMIKEFKPDFRKLGKKLTAKLDWNSPDMVCNVGPVKEDIQISLKGGIPKHPSTTLLGLKAIICHEIGHQLGGYPFFRRDRAVSNEGQADYWAAETCLPRLFRKDRSTKEIQLDPESSMYQICKKKFDNKKELQVCIKTIQASYEQWQLYHQLNLESITFLQSIPDSNLRSEDANRLDWLLEDTVPSLEVYDGEVVGRTNDGHSHAQCRLDTQIAGVLGLERPACWYKATNF